MRIAVVDLSSPLNNPACGLAGNWLRWKVKRTGHELTSEMARAEMVLCSSYFAPESVRIRQVRKIVGESVPVIVGGSGCRVPSCYGRYADVVCVGEGGQFLGVLLKDGYKAACRLPNAWVHGEERKVEISQDFPWDMPPIQGGDRAFRFVIGRGCPRRCAFCAVSWSSIYKEHPNPESLIRKAKSVIHRGKAVQYVSNDLSLHKWSGDLPQNISGSVSVSSLLRGVLPPARSIRIGVEGVSERIRSAIGKPISNEDLVNVTAWLSRSKKTVRWFMIAGMPGEVEDDWEELKDVILQYKMASVRGNLGVSFTAFTRHPATPLCGVAHDPDYYANFVAFQDWKYRGLGQSGRIRLFSPQQPKSLLKTESFVMDMPVEQICAEGSALASPNFRVKYPHRNHVQKRLDKYWSVMGK